MSGGGALWDALIAPFVDFAFMRVALAAALTLALANGPLGTLVLLRRVTLTSDVLAHGVMPGAALGFVIAGYSLFAMSLGGMATGLAIAAASSLVGRVAERRETALVAFYLVSLSLGVLLVSLQGSQIDLMHVLFGTILAVDAPSLVLMALVATVTLLVLAAIYRPLALGGIDPAFLRMVGGGAVFDGVFLCLIVVNLVAAFQALGTLLAAAPMLLPAAAARCWAREPGMAMTLSVGFGAVSGTVGLLVSFHFGVPSGPAIVLAGGALYALALGVDAARTRPAGAAPAMKEA